MGNKAALILRKKFQKYLYDLGCFIQRNPGSVLFVGVGVANTSIQKVIKPLIQLFLAMILDLLLITYVPSLSLWLPSKFGF